jgi:hypothetical protein
MPNKKLQEKLEELHMEKLDQPRRRNTSRPGPAAVGIDPKQGYDPRPAGQEEAEAEDQLQVKARE